MLQSTFNPQRDTEYDKTKLALDAMGAMGVCAPGVSTNIDLPLPDDVLIDGISYNVIGGVFGDYINLQVIDLNGTYTGAPGTVLNQFATKWYVAQNQSSATQIKSKYPAKILGGMALRLIYNSVGDTPANVAVNYELHKVLI